MKSPFKKPILGIVVALVIMMGISSSLAQVPSENSALPLPRGTYSYDEMVAAHQWVPSLTDSNLPICKPDPNWSPPETEDELKVIEQEAADAPECAADPRTFEYSIGYPAPHAGYHHIGTQTSGKWRGGGASIEGGNPAVDHTSTPEFIVGRVLGKELATSDWIEIGWAEVSWKGDGPYVYTFDDASNTWIFPSGYSIGGGSLVSYRVRDCTVSGTNGACAYIYWNGVWNMVNGVTHVKCLQSGSNNCYFENYLEAYSEQTGSPHPDIGAKRHRAADVRKNDGTWQSWTVSSTTKEVDPYNVCWISNYYSFDAGKGISC